MTTEELCEVLYAEEMPYWQTKVHPFESQAKIMVLLEKFGATRTVVSQGQAEGRLAWMIRFEWRGNGYRLVFRPLRCEHPEKLVTFGGRRTAEKQAEYQMGRIAMNSVKNLLASADSQFLKASLFGFMEVTAGERYPSGLPRTMAEIGAEELSGRLLASGLDEVLEGEGLAEAR